MRITLLQMAARSGRVDESLARARALVVGGPATDLVLLPEAALTGYVGISAESRDPDFDRTPFAETVTGPTMHAVSALAREAKAFIAAPLIERGEGQDAGRVYNAIIVVDREGRRVAHYRKRHPWYPETWATPGAAPHPVFAIEDATVTLAVCFDVHFLADEARAELDRAALLLFPSAWVEENDSRAELLAGLARAHHVAIANANWAAGDVVVGGQGGSMIVDARGSVIARAGRREERLDVELALPLAGAASSMDEP